MSEERHVFGPVPSRRLGMSLGVDIVPLKTCNWNCVYCQLGRTGRLSRLRRPYGSVDRILGQVREAVAECANAEGNTPRLDWVSIVSSGEPLLNSNLGEIIAGIKHLTDVPVAVLTNGSLLHDVTLWDSLAGADAVLPSLDAGSVAVYRRINRPEPELGYESVVDGLVAFSHDYPGRLWVEVMLVEGLNDDDRAVEDIATVLDWMRVDEVHVNTPVRPAAESWVRPSAPERVAQVVHRLGSLARRVPFTPAGVASGSGVGGEAAASTASARLTDWIASVVARHPLQVAEVSRLVGCAEDEAEEALALLLNEQRVQAIDRRGCRYWGPAGQRYARERDGGSGSENGRRVHHAER